MRKLALLLLFASSAANAQFVTGQILTAQQLNNAFANVLSLSGGSLTGPLTVPTLTVTGNLTVNGSFTLPSGSVGPSSLAPMSPNSVLGNPTNNTTTPTVMGLSNCNSGTSALGYANGAGFTCITNVNASTLNGYTFANPPTTGFGSSTPEPVYATTLSATSAFTATGLVTTTDLATQAANTVLANATASTASPTAVAMPSCSTATSALNWTINTGFTCNTAVNAATLGGATFASPGAIGGTTAASGKFTTLQATSTITPSSTAGIVGTTTNDNANAGSVGEMISNTTSGTSITTATNFNATSVSLTAGDWDLFGSIRFNVGAGAAPVNIISGINTVSATTPTWPAGGIANTSVTFTTGSNEVSNTGVTRLSLSSTTTVYLVAQMTFSGGSVTADGFLRARRIR